MAQEVHVFGNDAGKSKLNLLQDPGSVIYVFREPLNLQAFIKDPAGSTSPANINTVVTFPEVRKIRLCILRPISDCQLTELEANGGVDGPHLSPLIQAWREAIRMIPKDHKIQELQFDMECGQEIALRQVVRLLQHISTVMNLKSQESVRCSVIGCNDDRRIWLEQSIVGSG